MSDAVAGICVPALAPRACMPDRVIESSHEHEPEQRTGAVARRLHVVRPDSRGFGGYLARCLLAETAYCCMDAAHIMPLWTAK